MSSLHDFMPVGPCCVCDAELDHHQAGFCADCGQPFCWTNCGGWGPVNHQCDNCREDDEEKQT